MSLIIHQFSYVNSLTGRLSADVSLVKKKKKINSERHQTSSAISWSCQSVRSSSWRLCTTGNGRCNSFRLRFRLTCALPQVIFFIIYCPVARERTVAIGRRRERLGERYYHVKRILSEQPTEEWMNEHCPTHSIQFGIEMTNYFD